MAVEQQQPVVLFFEFEGEPYRLVIAAGLQGYIEASDGVDRLGVERWKLADFTNSDGGVEENIAEALIDTVARAALEHCRQAGGAAGWLREGVEADRDALEPEITAEAMRRPLIVVEATDTSMVALPPGWQRREHTTDGRVWLHWEHPVRDVSLDIELVDGQPDVSTIEVDRGVTLAELAAILTIECRRGVVS